MRFQGAIFSYLKHPKRNCKQQKLLARCSRTRPQVPLFAVEKHLVLHSVDELSSQLHCFHKAIPPNVVCMLPASQILLYLALPHSRLTRLAAGRSAPPPCARKHAKAEVQKTTPSLKDCHTHNMLMLSHAIMLVTNLSVQVSSRSDARKP